MGTEKTVSQESSHHHLSRLSMIKLWSSEEWWAGEHIKRSLINFHRTELCAKGRDYKLWWPNMCIWLGITILREVTTSAVSDYDHHHIIVKTVFVVCVHEEEIASVAGEKFPGRVLWKWRHLSKYMINLRSLGSRRRRRDVEQSTMVSDWYLLWQRSAMRTMPPMLKGRVDSIIMKKLLCFYQSLYNEERQFIVPFARTAPTVENY